MKILGKFRTDGDTHWYFIPENLIKRFDCLMAQMGLLDFYDEEWEEKNQIFNNEFSKYRLKYASENYLCEINIEQYDFEKFLTNNTNTYAFIDKDNKVLFHKYGNSFSEVEKDEDPSKYFNILGIARIIPEEEIQKEVDDFYKEFIK
jgi:hypothetical protein